MDEETETLEMYWQIIFWDSWDLRFSVFLLALGSLLCSLLCRLFSPWESLSSGVAWVSLDFLPFPLYRSLQMISALPCHPLLPIPCLSDDVWSSYLQPKACVWGESRLCWKVRDEAFWVGCLLEWESDLPHQTTSSTSLFISPESSTVPTSL